SSCRAASCREAVARTPRPRAAPRSPRPLSADRLSSGSGAGPIPGKRRRPWRRRGSTCRRRRGPRIVPARRRVCGRRRAGRTGQVAARRGLVVGRGGLYRVAMLALVDLLERHPDAAAVDYGFMVSVVERGGPAGGALVHRLLRARERRPVGIVRLPPPFGRC